METDRVTVIYYDNGVEKTISVSIAHLPPNLQELYKPFSGKTVEWIDGVPELRKQEAE